MTIPSGSRNPRQVRASQSRSPRPKTIEVARDQIGETVEVGAPSLVVLPLTLLVPKETSAPPEA